MNIRWIIAVALSLVLTAGFAACEQKGGEAPPTGKAKAGGIAWMEYDEGMAKAAEEGKPVMVDFYTTWCKYCKMLDETTYQDAGVISILNDKFVSIKVDAESGDTVTYQGKKMTKAELARSYKVTGYPTVWFIDEKGAPIDPVNYVSPEDLKPILTYISSGAYSRGVKYKDYLETLGPADTGEGGGGAH